MNRDVSQVNTTLVASRAISGTRHFMMGYDDAVRSVPYNKTYDTWSKVDDQWNYERGRHVACLAKSLGNVPKLFHPGTKQLNPAIHILFDMLVRKGVVR